MSSTYKLKRRLFNFTCPIYTMTMLSKMHNGQKLGKAGVKHFQNTKTIAMKV